MSRIKKERKIKIEYDFPVECHVCPIGEYIRNNFFQNGYNDDHVNAVCDFCDERDDENE